MTAYLSRTVGLSQAARIVSYMRSVGVRARAIGTGTLVLGTPSHLAVLTELAEHGAEAEAGREWVELRPLRWTVFLHSPRPS